MKLLITSVFALILSLMMPEKDKSSNIHSNQSPKPLFSFGILADAQYADNEAVGNRFYRSSLEKLRDAVTKFRKDSVDFIINLGDLIDKDFDSYKPVINILDSSGIKIYNVPGNHDYNVEPKLKKKLPVLNSSKEGYYSFIHEKFRFIVLNGN